MQNHPSWTPSQREMYSFRQIYMKGLEKFSCSSKSNQNLVELFTRYCNFPVSFSFYQITILKFYLELLHQHGTNDKGTCTDQSVFKIAVVGNFIWTTSQLKAFGSIIDCTGFASRNVLLLLLLLLLLRVTWILGPDLQCIYFTWPGGGEGGAWARKVGSPKQIYVELSWLYFCSVYLFVPGILIGSYIHVCLQASICVISMVLF